MSREDPMPGVATTPDDAYYTKQQPVNRAPLQLSRPSQLLLCAGLLCLIAATRWPLIPHQHLYHIDNVNFALALDHFDPRLDQPQPPGDPLYVFLSRLLQPLFPSPEVLFPVTGLLASIGSVIVLFYFAARLFGEYSPVFTGLAASLLLALNPVFWLAGVGNYVRVYSALWSIVVAALVWRCWNEEDEKARCYFWASFAALGIAAGFRPEAGLLLFPLTVSSVFVRRFRFSSIAIALLFLLAATLPWLLYAAWKVGGILALYRLNSGYLAGQSHSNSIFYSASAVQALKMAAAAFYWSLLGAVSWFWVLPMVWRKMLDARFHRVFVLLGLWFIPATMFFALIHIHNPDHALIDTPAVCLVGAMALSCLSAPIRKYALGVVVALNVVLFFYPTTSPFWASNYNYPRHVISLADRVYAGLRSAQTGGPVTVFWREAEITPQEMSYYFPDVPVIALLRSDAPQVRIRNTYQALQPNAQGEYPVRSGTLLWLDPVDPAQQIFFAPLGSSTFADPFHSIAVAPGQRFTLGSYTFVGTPRSQP